MSRIYSRLNDIPLDCEIVFRIVGKNTYSRYIAGDFAETILKVQKICESEEIEVHEVIRVGKPVKPYFDAEYYVKLKDFTEKKRLEVLSKLTECIIKASETVTYMIDSTAPIITGRDLIIGNGTREVEESKEGEEDKNRFVKVSYHIINACFMLSDLANMRFFYSLVASYFELGDASNYFDCRVYDDNSNFRLLVTPKLGDVSSRFSLNVNQHYESVEGEEDDYSGGYYDDFVEKKFEENPDLRPHNIENKYEYNINKHNFEDREDNEDEDDERDFMEKYTENELLDVFDENSDRNINSINDLDNIAKYSCDVPYGRTGVFINWTDDLEPSIVTYNHDDLPVVKLVEPDNEMKTKKMNTSEATDKDWNNVNLLMEKLSEDSSKYNICDLKAYEIVPSEIGKIVKLRRKEKGVIIKCNICKRGHENENISILLTELSENIYTVSINCFRKKTNQKIDKLGIFSAELNKMIKPGINFGVEECNRVLENSFVPKIEEEDIKLLCEKHNYMIRVLYKKLRYHDIKHDIVMPKLVVHRINHRYICDYMNEYTERTLLINSETGTGKSESAVKWAQKNPKKSALFIIPRKTLGDEYMGRLKGYNFFTHVGENRTTIEDKTRVICVINSIARIKQISFDLIVLDELFGILSQLPSIGAGLSAAIASLEFLLKTAKRVVIMDANLDFRSIEPFHEIIFGGRMNILDEIVVDYRKQFKNKVFEENSSNYLGAVSGYQKKVIDKDILNDYKDKIGLDEENDTNMVFKYKGPKIGIVVQDVKDDPIIAVDEQGRYLMKHYKARSGTYQHQVEQAVKTLNEPNDIALVINEFCRGSEQTWHVTTNDCDFFAAMINAAMAGERMVVSCTTKSMVNAIASLLESVAPDRSVVTIVGDTPTSSKTKRIIEFGHIISTQNTIMIYNTAVTVGVSTQEMVDKMFTISTNRDVTSYDVHQQTQRCRKIKEFYLLLGKVSPVYKPITRNCFELNSGLYASGIMSSISLPYHIDILTKRKIHTRNSAWALIVTSYLIKSFALREPNKLLLRLILKTGAKIELLKEVVPNLESGFCVQSDSLRVKDIRKTAKAMEIEKIVQYGERVSRDAILIDDFNLAEAKMKEIMNDGAEFKEAKRKYIIAHIRKVYNYRDTITEDFLHMYMSNTIRRAFERLSLYCSYKTNKDYMHFVMERESIRIIQSNIARDVKNTFDKNPLHINDLNFIYIMNSFEINNIEAENNKIVCLDQLELDYIMKNSYSFISKKTHEMTDIYKKQVKICNKFLNLFGCSLWKTQKKGSSALDKEFSEKYRVFKTMRFISFDLDNKNYPRIINRRI